MKRLESYLSGRWQSGQGRMSQLVDPTTEATVAECSSEGLDLAAALGHARAKGGPALRELGFAGRAELVRALSKAIHAGREELIELAVQNAGNTRSDAKFDIDGAAFTLAAYADLGATLGSGNWLVDGDAVQIGRTARLVGQHAYAPRRGVAVFVNAFNFPAWGLAEKAACALLAGMPVLCKPATATALVTWRMVQMFVEQKLLPDGALSLLCGSAGDLVDHLGGQDILSFTGSSQTARTLRSSEAVTARSVHVNIEADSLNAAVLGPDVSLASETGQLFLADVAKDMTQKTGQKCTAIRRVLAPADKLDDVVAELKGRLADLVIGNPAEDGVRMGPLATKGQLDDVRAGIARLVAATEAGHGDGSVTPRGVPAGKGYFVGPVLRVARDARKAAAVHEHEVFGPVATVCGYAGDGEDAAAIVGLGEGGLVCSVYSDDRDFLGRALPALAPYHGRIYLGSEKMAAQSPGPGTVIPHLLHGGPGRAGGGEELGGRRGLALYMQRTALEGDKSILSALLGA
jgi:oxepin-CoA hydrolase/3-oxo-5,6-dehydrosuberyl-CoA semialdehyde dehydrogenase